VNIVWIWAATSCGYGRQHRVGMGANIVWVWAPTSCGYGRQHRVDMGANILWIWAPTSCGYGRQYSCSFQFPAINIVSTTDTQSRRSKFITFLNNTKVTFLNIAKLSITKPNGNCFPTRIATRDGVSLKIPFICQLTQR
jgi:hypothetical protein